MPSHFIFDTCDRRKRRRKRRTAHDLTDSINRDNIAYEIATLPHSIHEEVEKLVVLRGSQR